MFLTQLGMVKITATSFWRVWMAVKEDEPGGNLCIISMEVASSKYAIGLEALTGPYGSVSGKKPFPEPVSWT
jgi:hypothetical protein